MEKQRLALERAAQQKEFDRYRMETDKTRIVLDTLKAEIAHQTRKLNDYKSKLTRMNADKAKAEGAVADAKKEDIPSRIKNANAWLTEVKEGIANATKDIKSIDTAITSIKTKQTASQKLFDAANGKFKAIEKKFRDAHFKDQQEHKNKVTTTLENAKNRIQELTELMSLASFKGTDAEGQKKVREELARMTADVTTATAAMDAINLAEAKEKEAEAWKKTIASRTKKEKERKGEYDKVMDEDKQVGIRMADIQKDISR